MASIYGSLQTPIFTGKNYEYWSLTMKALFKGQLKFSRLGFG